MNARRVLKKWLIERIARRIVRPQLGMGDVVRLDPRRILIVRQHNQMGDMVCATPAFRALRLGFPDAELALVCAPLNYEVVRHNPDLDRVLVFDRRIWLSPARFRRWWREIRSFAPDLAFVLSSVSFSVTSAAIAILSGAPVIVGADSRPFGWDISRHVFSVELPSRPVIDRHAVQHSLAPLAAIGLTTEDLRTVVVPSPAETAAAGRLLADHRLREPFWMMHPGAGKSGNLWPVARFAAVAARAASRADVLVLQGPADRQVMVDFQQALRAAPAGSLPYRILMVPIQPVGVCAALLARADRFLCNDTGLMHVAGAVGVPTLALFGPTDRDVWKPQAPTVAALQAEAGRLELLDEAEVWQAWAALPSRQTVTS